MGLSGCDHEWVETQRSYAGPPPLTKINSYDADLLLKLTMGLTSIEQRCSKCGEIRVQEAVGNLTQRAVAAERS